ncbi:hypothetical protein K435DRAFT_964332 [Dendrothele bispora CBS 962.96]|uniref:Kinase-like protein n=1 Tax=Dendrothele bispora (strain CBS 962.96) TaxID=1314807 RepID=A0A4S8MBM3_DENBC|nr:hypothetical protein K435DRAFT_964332 [Dendrothele bispora CBS 962.96]
MNRAIVDSDASEPALSQITQISEAKTVHVTLSQIELILSYREGSKRLLEQRGVLAQSILDLLQALYDYTDVASKLRSKILSVMIHLSRKSNLYPSCLILDNVTKIGDHPIAAGGFGEVWKGSIGGEVACLKVVKIYGDSDVEKLLKDFMKEAILWRQLDHPNVLPFLGLYFLDTTKQRVCLISPWMHNGNLRQFLSNYTTNSGIIDRYRLVHDTVCGLCYLHERKIVHGDLKAENILITLTGRAVIADFGLSRKVLETSILRFSSLSTDSHVKGSTRWLAPECLLHGESSTYSSDIYAFACVCYETFTGFVPFYEFPQDVSVIFQLSAGRRPVRPLDRSDLNDSMWEIMQECWSQESSMRPTAYILPTKIAGAACRMFEFADTWDNFLSRQLQRNVRHNEICPRGSPLEIFLSKTQSELLTQADEESIEVEQVVFSSQGKPLPPLPNTQNYGLLEMFQSSMGRGVPGKWEWSDVVPDEVMSSLSVSEVKRQWFIFEFIKEEMSHLKDLESIKTLFIHPLQESHPSIVPINHLDHCVFLVFNNITELHTHHRRMVEKLHEKQREEYPIVNSISLIIHQMAANFHAAYMEYLSYYSIATHFIDEELAKDSAFKDSVKHVDNHHLDIKSFITCPASHLLHYEVLLNTMLDMSPAGHEDQKIIPIALEIIKSLHIEPSSAFAVDKNRVEIFQNIVFRVGEWMDMDIQNENRYLLHCGNLLRQSYLNLKYNSKERSESFVLLFDNYLVITQPAIQDGHLTYIAEEKPMSLDLLAVECKAAPVHHNIQQSRTSFTRKSDPCYTLYAETAQMREIWKLKLEEALSLRRKAQEHNKVFQIQIFKRVATSLRTGKLKSWDTTRNSLSGRITCSVSFYTFDGRSLVAIGCVEGVWAVFRDDPQSMKKVLDLKQVSQCAVLDSYGIFLVLADGKLFAYHVESVIPTSTHKTPTPKKLSRDNDVCCFRTGVIHDRVYVIYSRKKGMNSLLQLVEPVQNLYSSSPSPKSDWFSDCKITFLPFETHDLAFLNNKIVIIQGVKGFLIMDLEQ